MLRRHAYLLLATLVLVSCEDALEPPPDDEPLVEPLSVTVDSSAGPIFRTVSATLDSAVAIEVDYWATGSPRLRVSSLIESLEHDVFLPRLRATTAYEFEIRAMGEAGQNVMYRGQFETDSLPAAVSALQIEVDGTPTFPLTMIEVRSPWRQVIVDQDGEIVWYRPGENRVSQGFTRLADGSFVFNERGRLSVETADHRVLAELDLAFGMKIIHHDVITTPDNTLLFLTQESALVDTTEWTGEVIWEWDPETDILVKRWSSFDFLDPAVDSGPRTATTDWLHANSLAVGPRGNVLVSLYWLHEVISIAADYQSVEWRLGGPSSSFAVEGGAMDAGQHTAAELSPGRVLLFDNGLDRPDSLFFSRAFEIELDHEAGTARIVWEFRPQPDIYAPVMSSARRLDNGNTVVLFGNAEGLVGASGPIALFEVTPSSEVVWSLHLEGPTGVYRATPLEHVGGEEEVTVLLSAR